MATLAQRFLPILCFLLLATPAIAQEKKDSKPQAVTMNTKDGVVLNATYLPGNRGRKTVPILLIHGWDGSRADMGAFALGLQRLGHAVLVPDLRGHGRSTKVSINGIEETIDREAMRKPAIEGGIALDLQACKKFLLEKHNDAELNIETLCLIGADSGAIFALNYAAFDWSKPQLPAYKLGRDVAAVVLLSPPRSFKGITTQKALVNPVIRNGIAVLIAAGQQDRKSYSAAKRLHNSLERFREEPENIAEKTLFFLEPDTSLTGADLLKGQGLRVAQDVAQFINLRLVQNPDVPEWKFRRSPTASDE